jgi:hypothetical protein
MTARTGELRRTPLLAESPRLSRPSLNLRVAVPHLEPAGLLTFAVGASLQVMAAMIDEDADPICGPASTTGTGPRVEGDSKRHRAGFCILDRCCAQVAARPDGERIDIVAVGHGGDDQLRPVRRERGLAGRAGELSCRIGMQPERPDRSWQRDQEPEDHPVALNRASVQRIEHVHQAAVDRHADREHPARGDDLAKPQPAAVRDEYRDGVASGVDGDRRDVVRRQRQRALRSQVIHDRAGQDAAEPAGRIGARLAQCPARCRS